MAIAVLLTVLVFLPLAQKELRLFPEMASTEKRTLAAAPGFHWKSLADFPKQYEAYFNDHFGFRNRLIGLYNWFEIQNALMSPYADSVLKDVIVGREGWLFYGWLAQGTTRFHPAVYSDADLEKIRIYLETVDQEVRVAGSRLILVIVPDKSTIYPEYLPSWFDKKDQRELDRILEYLRAHSDVLAVDLKGPLLNAKKESPVFYKTDTHWNDYGALIGCREITKQLSAYFPRMNPASIADYQMDRRPKINGGDLAGMLSGPDEFSDEEVRLKFKGKVRSGDEIPKALVFSDSFFPALEPFLSRHFQELRVPGITRPDKTLIRKEKADVVIFELAERYVQSRLMDN